METLRADLLERNIHPEISALFIDSFRQYLNFLIKDTPKLIAAFSHMMLPDCFYVALINGEIAGIAACTDGKTCPIRPNKRDMCRHLGKIKGTVAFIRLKRKLENHTVPFSLKKTTGFVEFVATAERFRGQGVASSIIRYIFKATAFQEYILAAENTNIAAIRLYVKLGFQELARIPENHSGQRGFDYLVYMKYKKRAEPVKFHSIEKVVPLVENMLEELGFIKTTVAFVYKLPDGRTEETAFRHGNLFCRFTFFLNIPDIAGVKKNRILLEYADSLHDASLHLYEDGDMIPLDLELSEIIKELEQEIRDSLVSRHTLSQ